MPTLFERIAAGDLPADIVYQDAEITAFRDIHPRAPVHILIIPNKPIPTANDITDTDAPLIGRLFLVARDLARNHAGNRAAETSSATTHTPALLIDCTQAAFCPSQSRAAVITSSMKS